MHNLDNYLTRIFIERYLERVSIMSIDGGMTNAEQSAYTDTIAALRKEIGEHTESIPSLELCKATEQHLRTSTSEIL